jgi:hypothetical protein
MRQDLRRLLRAAFGAFAISWLVSLETWALMGDTNGPFGLDGSFRTLAMGLDNFDFAPFFGESNETDFLSLSLLRLTAAGRPAEWVSYEAHLVQGLTYGTADSGSATPGAGLVPGVVRHQAWDATSNWLQDDHLLASLFVDRLNLRLSASWADLTVGRQAVTFGKAYFWNPLDVFLPFDPRQFDRDYKAGVDGIRLDVPLGDLAGLNFVGVAGREISLLGTYEGGEKAWDASWYGSSVLTRAFTTVAGWDVAVQGGKVYGGYQLAGGAAGEVGPVAVRTEASWLFADGIRPLPFGMSGELVEDHLQAVIGVGHRFESSLDLEAEYFYNGAGGIDDLDPAMYRQNTGGTPNLSRQLLGLVASYEFTPILTGQWAALVSLSDASFQLQPSLAISLANEVDLLLGAMLNCGDRPTGAAAFRPEIQSEFGAEPNVVYLELKMYF